MTTNQNTTYLGIKAECQKAVEKLWNSQQDKKAFAYCGGAFIKFKGIKNRKIIETLGFEVQKDYPSGFYISIHGLYEEPDYVKSVPDQYISEHGFHVNEIRAAWQQSMDLAEEVAKTAAEMLKAYGVDCWASGYSD